jgi:hypothetical protein
MVKGCASLTAASLKMKPLHEGIVSKKHESRKLAVLRDALSQKLMSWELRVGTTGKLVKVEL